MNASLYKFILAFVALFSLSFVVGESPSATEVGLTTAEVSSDVLCRPETDRAENPRPALFIGCGVFE